MVLGVDREGGFRTGVDFCSGGRARDGGGSVECDGGSTKERGGSMDMSDLFPQFENMHFGNQVDNIMVRVRRGNATDSHSIAEHVRQSTSVICVCILCMYVYYNVKVVDVSVC